MTGTPIETMESPFVLAGDQFDEVDEAREGSGPPPSTIRQGATGNAVARLQTALTNAGFATLVDGDFGPETDRNVRSFQSARGLTVDGVVGSQTWAVLPAGTDGSPSSPTQPPPTQAPGSTGRKDGTPDVPLGRLVVNVAGSTKFSYQFSTDDLIWTAKLLVHEAGGHDDPDNAAVLWAMFNRYALFTHRYYSTFHAFIRRYSTTLQPYLRSRGAAERHYRKGDAVYRRTGGVYEGSNIPKGQLVRHLEIQDAPWNQVKASARDLASRALGGHLPNPGIGLASEFASTMVYYRQRHGRRPTRQQWLDYTNAFARRKKWTFIGAVGGIDPTKNAFFVQNRVSHLPGNAVRVVASRDDEHDDLTAGELLEAFEFDTDTLLLGDDESALDDFEELDKDEWNHFDSEFGDEAVAMGVATRLDSPSGETEIDLEEELSPSAVARAVERNEHWADRLGWRQHFDQIVTLVGFTDMTPDAAAFSDAVSGWQSSRGLDADGIIGPTTWAAMRNRLGASAPPQPPGTPAPAPSQAPRSSSWLRRAWASYYCRDDLMVRMSILGRRSPVNPLTQDAWRALEQALMRAGYVAERAWNYNCRTIKGSSSASLHAYGLAVDIDAACHPFRTTPDGRMVRFAAGASQADRCAEVKAGRADTTFTPDQVAAVEAIRTNDGLQAIAWGGRWRTVKDGMHFQINVSPDELRAGIALS